MPEFEAVQPVLAVRNVSNALGFYIDRLGFSCSFQDTEENPHYAGVRRDNVEIHLQWHDEKEWEHGIDRPMLRFVISKIDELYDEFQEKNVFHAGTALRDTDWGTREFAFYDPDKNGLTFYCDLET